MVIADVLAVDILDGAPEGAPAESTAQLATTLWSGVRNLSGGDTRMVASTGTPLAPSRRDPSRAAAFARWLLVRGHNDAAVLRGWARFLRLQQLGTRGEKLRALTIGALASAWREWQSIRATVQEYGGDVHTIAGVSPTRQLQHLAVLRLRYGLTPAGYYRYKLYRDDRRPKAGEYLGSHYVSVMGTVRRGLARDARVLRDKTAFASWAYQHAIRTAVTVAEAHAGVLSSAVRLPHRDLIVKPATLICGRGVARYLFAGEPGGEARWQGPDGIMYGEAALLEKVRAASSPSVPKGRNSSRVWVVQERLRNDPRVSDLTAGGLCTVRVMTVRRRGQEPRVLRAFYRMPVGDTPADNFDAGGIAAPIELERGMLGAAFGKDPNQNRPYETHPTTGAQIAGRVLPEWDSVLALALRAHGTLPHYPLVGWDVVISEHGPLLLEGNETPCVVLGQLPTGEPLGSTDASAAIREALEDIESGLIGD